MRLMIAALMILGSPLSQRQDTHRGRAKVVRAEPVPADTTPETPAAKTSTTKTKPKPKPKQDDDAVLAAKVQKAYEGVKDLRATFSQQTTVQGGARKGPKVTGKFFLKKPGKVRWEFDEALTFVSDGSTLWQYDPDENQVIVNKYMKETTSMTALNFLGGMGGLTKSFDVEQTPAKGEGDRGVFLLLKPKDEEDVQLQQLVLVVSRKTWLATEAYLTDPLGNETHLIFSDLKTNSKLKDDLFTFKIPEGADVIEPSLLR